MVRQMLERPIDDGLPTRKAGEWVRDKLAILECYFHGFCVACSGRAHRWYYVEGFAGSGVNRIETTGDLVWGSAMLALDAEPAFTTCVLLEMADGRVARGPAEAPA